MENTYLLIVKSNGKRKGKYVGVESGSIVRTYACALSKTPEVIIIKYVEMREEKPTAAQFCVHPIASKLSNKQSTHFILRLLAFVHTFG